MPTPRPNCFTEGYCKYSEQEPVTIDEFEFRRGLCTPGPVWDPLYYKTAKYKMTFSF